MKIYHQLIVINWELYICGEALLNRAMFYQSFVNMSTVNDGNLPQTIDVDIYIDAY